MDMDLTGRQREILNAIRDYMEQEGKPPTIRELGDMFGFASSTVFQHLGALERKGFIKRTGGASSRSIEIVGFDPGEAIKAMRKVPLIGRVAAGLPILADENVESWVYVDGTRLRGGEFFSLRVKGDSMIGAGILEGDILVVRRQDSATPGDIVVALIGEEATVKRLDLKNRRYALMPENPKYVPILVDEDTIILGKVVCVQRMLD